MKITKAIILTMGLAAVMTACDKKSDDSPVGSWSAAAPESVTASIPGASSATKTLALDFNAPVNGADGVVTLTADYDVTVAASDSVKSDSTYTATATIKGTWAQDVDDHDDYLLSFDKNSLSVSGVDAPELGPVTDDFLNSLSAFTTIEDVEVSKDGTHLTFESGKPHVEYHFVKK